MTITFGSNLGLMVNAADGEGHANDFRKFLRGVDGLVQCTVADKDLTTPPGSPVDGDAYIVAAGATGAWAGQGGKVTRWSAVAAAWEFYTPREGWTVAVRDENHDYRHDGTNFVIAPDPQLRGYADGLALSRNSGTSISVSSGVAWVESLSRFVRVPTALTKAGLSLSASTLYYVYLFETGGTGDVEIVTTAPAAAYSGTARSKTGDTSRRCIGSIATDGSGNVLDFRMSGNRVFYKRDATATPHRVLGPGVATTWASVSFAALVPAIAVAAQALIQNVSTSFAANIASEAAGAGFLYTVNPKQAFAADFLLSDAAPKTMHYQVFVGNVDGLYIDVWGYVFER